MSGVGSGSLTLDELVGQQGGNVRRHASEKCDIPSLVLSIKLRGIGIKDVKDYVDGSDAFDVTHAMLG